jgi:hypothetical protein
VHGNNVEITVINEIQKASSKFLLYKKKGKYSATGSLSVRDETAEEHISAS